MCTYFCLFVVAEEAEETKTEAQIDISGFFLPDADGDT